MSNLIRAEIYRCKRSLLFWFSLCAAFLSGAFFGYIVADGGYFDDMFLVPLFVILAAFFSLNIGREYADGTIRNKIIAGKTKTGIYFSRIFFGIAVTALMVAVFLIPFVIISANSVLSRLPVSLLLWTLLGFFLLNFAWAIIFTVVSTLICSREIAGILNLILVIGIMFAAYQLEFLANQPKYIRTESYITVPMTAAEVQQLHDGTFVGSHSSDVNEDGVVTHYKDILSEEANYPNPNYLPKPLQAIFEQIDHTLPHGQINLYVSCLTDCIYADDLYSAILPASYWKDNYSIIRFYPLYSLALITILSVIGWLGFRKKDLK